MTPHGVRPGGTGIGVEPGAALAELRGDCAHMSARWAAPPAAPANPPVRPVARIRVDPRSVRLVAGMPEYGG
ncbi:hypothetical protein [Streptomyces sp. DW26H14]|uniref:hypothetical protein n=1 Tax=Streptomyces sp. DW26H14 TaxID=3435395 RepID=UPI00403DBB76